MAGWRQLAFIATDDVDGLHRAFADKEALILSAPEDEPWGRREMAVGTPEGHRLMVAEWIGKPQR